MPPKGTKVQQQRRKPSVTSNFSYNGAPFIFPGAFSHDGDPFTFFGDEGMLTAKDIVDRIRIDPDVTLTPTRKLLKAALEAKCLVITIGVPPGSPRQDETANAPNFYYDGYDIMQLGPLIKNKQTILERTATICVGDGGSCVEDDDDAEQALNIIQKNYRDPILSLYF